MSSIVCRAFKFKNQVHTRYLVPVTTVHTQGPGTSARRLALPHRGYPNLGPPRNLEGHHPGAPLLKYLWAESGRGTGKAFQLPLAVLGKCVQCQPLEAVSGHRAD